MATIIKTMSPIEIGKTNGRSPAYSCKKNRANTASKTSTYERFIVTSLFFQCTKLHIRWRTKTGNHLEIANTIE